MPVISGQHLGLVLVEMAKAWSKQPISREMQEKLGNEYDGLFFLKEKKHV